MNSMENKDIISEIINQMSEDFEDNYMEAIEEMLGILIENEDNKKVLLGYLPEEIYEDLNK